MPTTCHLATIKDLGWRWERMARGCLICLPPDFFLYDIIHCLLRSQLSQCFLSHRNYYVQSVHLGWGYAHLSLANRSLWRRFKDKHVFPLFHQKYCYSTFRIIQDPVKYHFCQAVICYCLYTPTALLPLLFHSILLSPSFSKYLLSTCCGLGSILGTRN